jgi:4-amino-4-deoxy-L-arabinose transferase-like glycosyltransferase
MASRQSCETPEPGYRSHKLLVIFAALCAGLILRLWFINHAARIAGDTFIYGDIAKNWLSHGIYGFTRDNAAPVPTLIRLPGYPLFMALCFAVFGQEHYGAVLYTQVAIDLFTCLLTAALARRLFGRRAYYAALWIAALCPFTASYAAAGLAETLTLATIALAFYTLLRWEQSREAPYNRWLYLLAATLAYSILLRPDQGLLAAAILPAMLWFSLGQPNLSGIFSKLSLKTAAPALLTAFLTLLPLASWTIRNWQTFHIFQPLAPRYATDPGETIPLGFYRWFRTWGIDFVSTENAYWNYNGATISIADLPNRAFDDDSQYARTDALLNEYNKTSNATPAIEASFAALAAERIHADPIRYYITLPVARLLNMLFRPRVEMLPIKLEWWKFSQHPGQTIFSTAFAALNLAFFICAYLGLRLWRRLTLALPPASLTHATHLALIISMAAFIVLRCGLLLTLDNPEPRYTLEFFPILIVWWAALYSSPANE